MKILKAGIISILFICLNLNVSAQEVNKESNSKYMEWCGDLKQRLELSPSQIEKADHIFYTSNKKVSKELLPKEDYNRLNDKEKLGYKKAMLEKEYNAIKDVAMKMKGVLNDQQMKALSTILNEKAQEIESQLKAIMISLR